MFATIEWPLTGENSRHASGVGNRSVCNETNDERRTALCLDHEYCSPVAHSCTIIGEDPQTELNLGEEVEEACRSGSTDSSDEESSSSVGCLPGMQMHNPLSEQTCRICRPEDNEMEVKR